MLVQTRWVFTETVTYVVGFCILTQWFLLQFFSTTARTFYDVHTGFQLTLLSGLPGRHETNGFLIYETRLRNRGYVLILRLETF